LDGNWGGRVIEGDRLIWGDGSTSVLKHKTPTECRLLLGGRTYEGKLDADGNLRWCFGFVWVRNESEVPKSRRPDNSSLQGEPDHLRLDLLRLEREAQERALEKEGFLKCQCGAWNPRTHDGRCLKCGKDQKREEDVYIGKPHLSPSWDGGGWGGPKEGHDKDDSFMLRGEARELPDHLYKDWHAKGRFINSMEQKMTVAKRVAKEVGSGSDSDSSREDQKKKKKEKRANKKRKQREDKKNKKGKKDKKAKKAKKEKGKKVKKDGKKKHKSA